MMTTLVQLFDGCEHLNVTIHLVARWVEHLTEQFVTRMFRVERR